MLLSLIKLCLMVVLPIAVIADFTTEINMMRIQNQLHNMGAKIDPFPIISNITKDFPFKFMTQAPCLNDTICGSCQKIEIWLTLKDTTLNFEIDISCLKCSSGYPKFGSVSTTGSSMYLPTTLDISDMCTWYSKAMAYTFWGLIFTCCFTCIACKCCSKRAPKNNPDQYFAYKGPESITNHTLSVGPGSLATVTPQLGQAQNPPGYYQQPIRPVSGSIYSNTLYPPQNYAGPSPYQTPAQLSYEATLRPTN